VEPLERTVRPTGVQDTRCKNLPRLSDSIRAARQSAEYAAGYAEALAENAGDDAEEADP
jgi:hypothetical protein